MATASDVLKVARGEIGYSRWSDAQEGTKYGRWYADQVKSPYYAQSGVPFCAMGVSWAFAHANALDAMRPVLLSAYCPEMVNRARSAGMAVAKASAQPGDVLMFDWGGDGTSDHTGICEANKPTSGYMQTIEFNTNNGEVCRRTRAYSTICQVIRPKWTGNPSPAPSPDPSPSPTPSARLEVDGLWGSATTARLQQVLGTVSDGVVDSQWSGWRAHNPGLTTGWQWVGDAKGSPMVRAMQRRLGVEADGLIGPDTIRALQRRMGAGIADGHLDLHSPCVKELQRRLNRGTF